MRGVKRFVARICNFATGRRTDERLRESRNRTWQCRRKRIFALEWYRLRRRQARLKLEAIGAIRERYHEEEGMPLLEGLIQDSKFALRQMRKSPGFNVVAVLTVALGVGANTATFELVNAAFIRALPYPKRNASHSFGRTTSVRAKRKALSPIRTLSIGAHSPIASRIWPSLVVTRCCSTREARFGTSRLGKFLRISSPSSA